MFNKTSFILISALAFAIITSCKRNECLNSADNFYSVLVAEKESADYVIPIEAALNLLDDFLKEQGVVADTKSPSEYIDNYFAVGGSRTKGGEPHTDLIYAVNFTGDGYALLAADSRIREDILAVVERGSVSIGDFQFINYYLTPTDNDDLSVEEYYEMVNSGVLAAEEPDNMINQLCVEFAEHEISFYDDDNNNAGGAGGSGPSGPVAYQWQTVAEEPTMLTTLWTQEGKDTLFNKYCPEVGLIIKTKAPAGCVPIAVGQIIAFHEYPSPFECSGMDIDFPAIKEIYSVNYPDGTGTISSQEMLARFVAYIGSLCDTGYHSLFGKSWGFSTPWDARDCLSSLNYENVSFHWGVNEDRIVTSLDNGCPVFMSAVSGLIHGHAWVVDGYKKRTRVSSMGGTTYNQTLLHCNWGWHGDCNGFFSSGIFNTQEAVIIDNGSSQNQNYNFTWLFNIVTYDNPNQ